MKHKIIYLKKILAFIISLFFLSHGFIARATSLDSQQINIVDKGALGNGEFLNTEIIQKTIDELSQSGGGTIVIPEGIFHCGSIEIKSGIILQLNFGAILLGSTNPDHYLDEDGIHHFIEANNATNIGIKGEGTIDGQGRKLALQIDSLFHEGKWKFGYNFRRHRPNGRPKLLNLRECTNIHLEGFTAKNSANWVLNFDLCENLIIHKVTVDSDDYWNNDGMDIGDCRNVRITNCHVNSADDGICLKSHHAGFFNDSIYIADCTVRSSASAIKFGTASVGGFKNVKIKNIFIFDTFRSAIALESVDGGILENIEIEDITASNTGNAIFIRLGHRNSDGEVGSLRNVRIRNVTVQVPFGAPDLGYDIRGPELPFFHNPFPASITGIPGHKVENVSLENIRIIYPGRANRGYAQLPLHRLDDVPENEADYPEFHMFGELPAWGFYVRHVEGLQMKNICLEVKNHDFRPALVFDDVEHLFMGKIWIQPTNSSDQIIFKDVFNKEIGKVDIEGLEGNGIKTLN